MRMKCRLFVISGVIIVLLLSVFALTQASEADKYGGKLIIAESGEPPTMDLVTTTSTATLEISYHILESLLTIDEKFKPILQLAKDWSSNEDYTTFTFTLREKVLFHNGKEMTSEDVKASINRFLDVSPRAIDLEAIEEVKILDDYKLEIILKESMPNFIPIFSNPQPMVAIMPKEVVEDLIVNKFAASKHLIGTGPFKFNKWSAGGYISLKRFEDYQADTRFPASGLGGEKIAYVDELKFVFVGEPGGRVAGILSGDYLIATALPRDEHERFREDERFKINVVKPWYIPCTGFNTTHPPFDDVKARRAVLAALNMDEIMYVVGCHEDFYRVDSCIYRKETAWYNPIGEELGLYNQNDLEKAKKLLEEAGYDGELVRIVVNADCDWMYPTGLGTFETLRNIGMNVEIVALDWPGVNARVTDLNVWEMAVTGFSIRSDPSGLDVHLTGKGKQSTYESEEMNELLHRARVEPDFDKRYELYGKVQELVYKDVPFIKYGDVFGLTVSREEVKNFNHWYLGTYWNVWLDE